MKILWLFRRYPKPEQVEDLRSIFVEDAEIIRAKEKITRGEQVKKIMEEYDCQF